MELYILVVVGIAAMIGLVAARRNRKRPRDPVTPTSVALEWAAVYYDDSVRRDIAARFVTILSEYVPIETLTPESTFVRDLGLNDLEPVEIVMAMEDEFKISIPDEETESLLAVSDVISYLDQRIRYEK